MLLLRNSLHDEPTLRVDKGWAFSPDVVTQFGRDLSTKDLIDTYNEFIDVPLQPNEENNVFIRGRDISKDNSHKLSAFTLRAVPGELILWPQVWNKLPILPPGPIVAWNDEEKKDLAASDVPFEFQPSNLFGFGYAFIAVQDDVTEEMMNDENTRLRDQLPPLPSDMKNWRDYNTFLKNDNRVTYSNIRVADPSSPYISVATHLRLFEDDKNRSGTVLKILIEHAGIDPDVEVSLSSDTGDIKMPLTKLVDDGKEIGVSATLPSTFSSILHLNILQPQGSVGVTDYSWLSLQAIVIDPDTQKEYLLGAENIIFCADTTHNLRFFHPSASSDDPDHVEESEGEEGDDVDVSDEEDQDVKEPTPEAKPTAVSTQPVTTKAKPKPKAKPTAKPKTKATAKPAPKTKPEPKTTPKPKPRAKPAVHEQAHGWWFRDKLGDTNSFPRTTGLLSRSPDIQPIGSSRKADIQDLIGEKNQGKDYTFDNNITFTQTENNYVYLRGHCTRKDTKLRAALYMLPSTLLIKPQQYKAHQIKSGGKPDIKYLTTDKDNEFILWEQPFDINEKIDIHTHYCLIAEVAYGTRRTPDHNWPHEHIKAGFHHWIGSTPNVCWRNIHWKPAPVHCESECCVCELEIPAEADCPNKTYQITMKPFGFEVGSEWQLTCDGPVIKGLDISIPKTKYDDQNSSLACQFTGIPKQGYKGTICVKFSGNKAVSKGGSGVEISLSLVEGLLSSSRNAIYAVDAPTSGITTKSVSEHHPSNITTQRGHRPAVLKRDGTVTSNFKLIDIGGSTHHFG